MLEISNLFWIMLAISAVVFFAVTFVLLYSAVRFRHREGQEEPTQVFGNRTVEIAWTLAPTLILIGAFIATVKAIHDINTASPGRIMNIDVIGHQWWWEFRYPVQQGISSPIVTATELHVPTGISLHLHITSNDVVHSFWTPELQRQIDANPAIDNAVFVKLERPGTYAGDCYEYCGTAHAWMKYFTVVETPAQFAAWVRAQERPAVTPSSASAQIKRGQYLFLHNTCVDCHAISGTSAGGVVGPNLTHVGSRQALAGAAVPMDPKDVAGWIQNPDTYKPGVLMPGYPLFSKQDLNALAAYIMSLK